MTKRIHQMEDPGVNVYEYWDDVIGFCTPAGTVFFDPKDPERLRVVPKDSTTQVHEIHPTAFTSGDTESVFAGLRLKQVPK